MNSIKHPYGNIKSSVLKNFKLFLSKLIRFFTNIFCKMKDNEEILISSGVYCPWKDDRQFYTFFKIIKKFTLLDFPRAFTLWKFSKNLSHIKADILDIGCLLGGSGFLLSKANTKGRVLLFDTFDGFKKDDGLHTKNTFFFNDVEFVKKNIKKLKLKNTNVYKSHFPKKLKMKIKKVKICHLDVNTFSETKSCFDYIENKIVKGGAIIFDDYGIWGVDGIKTFVNSIEKKYQKSYHFVYNYMGQCIMIKR
tara:strand:+ start:359 stop:1108 length:750 start_codon:yes stop_codon:yes gene_type:complete